MKTIGDLLTRDLSEPIEEVIKLDQQDEKTVYSEITEYVATDRIKDQYIDVLEEISSAPGHPTEGVGMWISGFFGSGKSSFAKNLGYILSNREILGQPAAEVFINQLQQQSPGDPLVRRIQDLVEYINARTPTKVVMFDVQVDRAVRKANEPIAEIVYTVLLRELDYAQDYDIAELEIDLEWRDDLSEFVKICAGIYNDEFGNGAVPDSVPATLEGVTPDEYAIWQVARKSAMRMQIAGAVLSEMYPDTFPTPDSWATGMEGRTDITIRTVVDRTFELTERRRPGHAIAFIIDEVGQYVARSADKIENLRAVVEHFGQESRNRVARGLAIAPVWFVVTSQEKLEEVVAAIDDKRVDLAKLQDRFAIKIDMAPADIREVATRRVLAKTPEAEKLLAKEYQRASATLKTHTRLERPHREVDFGEDDFIQFYPYLPHFIDLSIDIVSGIRLEPGGPRHIGGSNRTIIKQAYEMLVHDRTRLMDAPVGRLVSLDLVYELVEGNLSSEKRTDIDKIMASWPDDPWPARTAKAIALLEYVRDLPRTDMNIAALLYRGLGEESPLPDIQRSIELLRDAQYIKQTESGWKLQTAQEKNWTIKRNSYNPTPRERNEILEERLRTIFEDRGLSRYRYKNLRTFQLDVTWEGRPVVSGKGQVPLLLKVADGSDEFRQMCNQTQKDSRDSAAENEVYWVMSLSDTIDELVAEVYRSGRMIGEYDQLRAQGKLKSAEESASLAAEKTERLRHEERLKELILGAMTEGKGYFRGNEKHGPSLGHTFGEIINSLFQQVIPDLYPRLEMGAKALPKKGKEAEEILKAANLNGLPQIFYDQSGGLAIVTKKAGNYVVDQEAPIAKEILAYLEREQSYGNTVTGRVLENYFGGLGYGWEQEVLWIVLAALLRDGAIEVTYQGKCYRNHLDPRGRAPFSGTNAFRSASFSPRTTLDLKTKVDAAKRYEALTGESVDVEETAIAQAVKNFASDELELLREVKTQVSVHKLPWGDTLDDYQNLLNAMMSSDSDAVVSMLAGQGESIRQLRGQATAIRDYTNPDWLAYLKRLQQAVNRIWPLLQQQGVDGELRERAEIVEQHVNEGTFYEVRDEDVAPIEARYQEMYQQRYMDRRKAYLEAIDEVKAQPAWSELFPETGDGGQEELRSSLLKPLTDYLGEDVDYSDALLKFNPSLAEMGSDIAAVSNRRAKVILDLQQLVAPSEQVEAVSISAVAGVGRTLQTEEDVEQVLEELRAHLMKLIAAGTKVVLE